MPRDGWAEMLVISGVAVKEASRCRAVDTPLPPRGYVISQMIEIFGRLRDATIS